MDGKHLFTKIAMSILIGLNVGAFYVFWPHQDGGARPQALNPDDQGADKLLPGKPSELPNLSGAVPLNIPKAPAKAELVADETVNKLLDHIKREDHGKQDESAKPGDVPAPPVLPIEIAPKTLPPLQVGDIVQPTGNRNVGVTTPVTPRVPDGPWEVQTGNVGIRTLLTATLRHPGKLPVEFRIQCDRVETNTAEIVASGKVTFAGVGLNGTCQRLTLSLVQRRLVFEDGVQLVRDGESQLRGDRIVWEIPSDGAPAGALGAPK